MEDSIMRFLTTATTIAFLAGSTFALAQAPATNNDHAPGNPAVKTTEGNNPGAPAAGANSFTEGQAKARIEARGYANVSGLAKDTNGFWRAKAMKDGKSVDVTLDYQGNVTVN
jgi:hypothetical protein